MTINKANRFKVKVLKVSHRFCNYKKLIGEIITVYEGTIHYYRVLKGGEIRPILKRDCKKA